jgi:hypothetical protein
VYIAAAGPQIRRVLLAHDVRPPRVHYARTQGEAVAAARALLSETQAPEPAAAA